jgi:hypothetical protein
MENSNKILVFYGNQPCLDITTCDVEGPNFNVKYGVNRDRNPDRDWSELRKSRISTNTKEVEMTPELKIILLEDLAYTYGQDSKKFNAKLKEFKLI